MLVIGAGSIGGALIDELLRLRGGETLAFILTGGLYVANSKGWVRVDDEDWREWRVKLQNDSRPFSADILIPDIRIGCVIDCTASEWVGSLYHRWMMEAFGGGSSIRVITANKKGLATGQPAFDQLRPAIWSGQLGMESTVGAGLPVIRTILHMQQAGDRIKEIRAILSGSLSYILTTYCRSQGEEATGGRFSNVVREAMRLEYTVRGALWFKFNIHSPYRNQIHVMISPEWMLCAR